MRSHSAKGKSSEKSYSLNRSSSQLGSKSATCISNSPECAVLVCGDSAIDIDGVGRIGEVSICIESGMFSVSLAICVFSDASNSSH